MFRRSLFLVIAALCLPGIALAASWHHAGSKSLGFTVLYPPGWHESVIQQPDGPQLVLSYQGKRVYALMIQVLALKPASSASQTTSRFVQYERRQGSSEFDSVRWSRASIGGRPAESGIARPSTEGGVAAAQGIYVVASKTRVYEITLASYGSRAVSAIGQFPAVYRQILATWRFK